ncbi:DUF3098 domain-containing protein [Pontibacter sp. G13]|uniref:DUF3098 domain-containing protein n=1 Tax=Pontibacter sp. G13 TaxID=3074898 RepID=UPI00288B08FD|nr:DUF3098 domain-containing protein [Pontibacter sp. G13]WNJ20843.1 DUF3098 domain-containing protein [Pontibacter sp. G13]
MSAKKTTKSKAATASKTEETKAILPFTRKNYVLLIIGVLLIGAGFLLMSMDDFIDANEFSVSLYIAPIVVMAGFIEVIYAIMYQEKNQPEPAAEV